MDEYIKKETFEYLNDDSIDEELKCSICIKPFTCPVYNPECGHTFCFKCIKIWHKSSSLCPICRQHVHIKDYKNVVTRIVINQLSRLKLKCNLCQQINIDNREKHISICPKQIIKCPSSDIQCQWKGKREDLQSHLGICIFQQIRPIVDQLNEQIQIIKQIQYEQQRFIQSFINNGYTLSHLCSLPHCYLRGPFLENKPYLMPCSLCNQQIHPKQIALHSCITNNCICRLCLSKYTNEKSQTPDLSRKREVSSSDDNDD